MSKSLVTKSNIMTYNKRQKPYIKGKGTSRRRSSFVGSLLKVSLPLVLLTGVLMFAKMNLEAERKAISKTSEPKISGKKIHRQADVMPYFPDREHVENKDRSQHSSIRNAKGFIYDNLEYPIEYIGKGGGKVNISFVVDKEGNVVNPEILHDSNGFGDAVMKALQAMPPWIPGKKAGVPVDFVRHLYVDIDERQYLVTDTSKPLKSDAGNFIIPEKMAYITKCEGMTDGNKQVCNKQYIRQHISPGIYGGSTISLNRSDNIKDSSTYLKFMVNKEGNITKIKAECGNEDKNKIVESRLKNMPQWIPAQHNGKPVNVELVFSCRIGYPGY